MIDTTKVISDQIRMLQDLRRLSRKPRFWETVKLIQPNEPRCAAPTDEKPSAVLDTGITKAVVATLSRVNGDYSYPDVIKGLTQDGYNFQTNNKRDAVGRVLRNLAGRGQIKEVRKGTGGEATVYRNIG